MAETTLYMVRECIQNFKISAANCMVAQSLWTSSRWRHAPDYCGKTCVLKTPVVRDTLLSEVSENSMIIGQGKRLRVRRNGRFDEHLQGKAINLTLSGVTFTIEPSCDAMPPNTTQVRAGR